MSGWGRFPCPLRRRTRPEPPRSPHRLPPSRGPPSCAGVAWPSPSSPSRPGQPASRQAVPNSVHTQRLPAPAGSRGSAGQEVWPAPNAHTHSLAAGWTRLPRPREVSAPGVEDRAGAGQARLGPCTPGAVVYRLLFIPSLGAPPSAKPEKPGQFVPAVTSRLPCSSRWGSFSCQLR